MCLVVNWLIYVEILIIFLKNSFVIFILLFGVEERVFNLIVVIVIFLIDVF